MRAVCGIKNRKLILRTDLIEMNYNQAIKYIHQTPKFSRVLGNDFLRALLEKMNNPHKTLSFIHIAGTNGKGSAAAMISQILTKSGFKVGLFTSPYIMRYNERIKINGVDISDEDLARETTLVRGIIRKYDTPVSEFALGAAIAMDYFNKSKCDFVVLETGLGGRLDATNVIEKPLLSIIMSIGLDHTQYLGGTIPEITREKCGIIKSGCPTVVYPDISEESLKIIKETCVEKNSKLYVSEPPEVGEGNSFLFNKKEYTLSLSGEFQKYNAAAVLTAIGVLRGIGVDISDAAVDKGLKTAVNPARFEKLDCGIILDGAHNPPAAAALSETVNKSRKSAVLCVAMMLDKDIAEVVGEFSKIKPEFVIATQLDDMPRCAAAEVVADEFVRHGIKAEVIKSPLAAARGLIERTKNRDDMMPIVCGSLYLCGEVRRRAAAKELCDTFYVYMIRCDDDSLYCGYTTDLKRRFNEHKSGEKGAKYTRAHGAAAVAAAWTAYSRSAAMRLEAFLKKLKKTEKEELGSNPKILFEKYKDRFVEGEYNVSN